MMINKINQYRTISLKQQKQGYIILGVATEYKETMETLSSFVPLFLLDILIICSILTSCIGPFISTHSGKKG